MVRPPTKCPPTAPPLWIYFTPSHLWTKLCQNKVAWHYIRKKQKLTKYLVGKVWSDPPKSTALVHHKRTSNGHLTQNESDRKLFGHHLLWKIANDDHALAESSYFFPRNIVGVNDAAQDYLSPLVTWSNIHNYNGIKKKSQMNYAKPLHVHGSGSGGVRPRSSSL